MTLVAIWRISLQCRVFLAKMVMRSMKKRTASSFVMENFCSRAWMAKEFVPPPCESLPP
jgi:hypothetical protein